jgi:aminopeptidase N
MMKTSFFGCLLGSVAGVAATFCSVGPAFAIDPFFPTFGNNGIDVRHYNIDLDVDPVSGTVKGLATLAINAERRLTDFSLDLHGLAVTSVKVNGAPARFTQVDDKLTIRPFTALTPRRLFVVSVTYAGTPDGLTDPTDATYDLGWFKYGDSTYVVSEPIGASTFFPANDEPTDKATYSFGITVPFGYMGLANGKPIGSTTIGNKTKYRWAMLQPMTSWLATVHVNKFNTYTQQTPNGIPVRVYSTDNASPAHVQGYARAAEMIPYFESLIGPYPFASYGSVLVEDPVLYYALETQAMSTFRLRVRPPSENLVAHELVHQWFGDSISVARWEDLWIAEGTATYFSDQWDFRNDPAGFDAVMFDRYNYVVQEQLGPAIVDAPDQLFSDRTYERGAMALYALRQMVGDTTFIRIMRRFHAESRGGNVTTQGFIDTAERVSANPDVRALLHAWLYEVTVPEFPGFAPAATARSAASASSSYCGRVLHRDVEKMCE